MRYLLDVNALIALGFANHQFHPRIVAWLRSQTNPAILTCSITELGFVRILAQAPQYGLTVEEARELLLRLKRNTMLPLTAIADNNDISNLPQWVKSPRQLTFGATREHGWRGARNVRHEDSRSPFDSVNCD